MAVCIVAGLIAGFTFFGTMNSFQGCQNKLFVRPFRVLLQVCRMANIPWTHAVFLVVVMCVPSAQQVQGKFLNGQTVYEVRERPVRMFTWSAFLVSEIPIESSAEDGCLILDLLLLLLGFQLRFFSCGVFIPFYCAVFSLYYTTFGLAVVVISPNGVISFFGVLFSFLLIFYIWLSHGMAHLTRTDG